MSTNDLPEIIRERRLAELRAQIEMMRTMPEGEPLPSTPDREMTERRRARYVQEGMDCLAAAEAMDAERLFRCVGDNEYLFHDDLMS